MHSNEVLLNVILQFGNSEEFYADNNVYAILLIIFLKIRLREFV